MAYNSYFVVRLLLLNLYYCHGQNLDESSYNKSCEQDDCSICFNRLVYETLYRDQNQFSLQKAFYPPDDAPPVFVIVTYKYSYPNGSIAEESKKWYWSSATYYFFQPLPMLQYTSLFFADPDFKTKTLTIILSIDCMNVDASHMQLLTQRLQLFTQSRSMYPQISSDYQPKAENETTLNEYIKNNMGPVQYLFCVQFIFYLLSIAGTPFLIFYLLFGFPVNLTNYIKEDKISNTNDDDEKAKYWEKDTMIIAGGIISWIFWMYAFIMSILGVHYQLNLPPELDKLHKNEFPFRLLYGITILILVQNVCTPFIYGILYTCVWNCWVKTDDIEACKNCKVFQQIVGVTSLSLPITILVVHFNHIVIGFIHDQYHATSVSCFYGFVILLHVIMLKIITHLFYQYARSINCENYKVLSYGFTAIYLISSIVLCLFVSFVSALYILLPINDAFDEAPNRVNTLVSTLILVFSGYMVFLLFKLNKRVEEA